MSALKNIFKAFAVGGACGLVGQALIMLVAGFIPDTTMVVLVAMLLFGVIGVILIVTGLYGRIAKFGGDGAAIPLCGLMNGAAGVRAGAQMAGMSSAKAVWTGFSAIIKVLGAGFIISLVVGLLWRPSGAIAPAAVSPALALVFAIIIGGAICALVQALSELKLPFPVIAIVFVVLGGVLTPIGVMDWLNSLGAGGASVTAMGCGNGAYNAGLALSGGVVIPLILVAALNIILVFMGALSGGALVKHHPEAIPAPPPQKEKAAKA